MDATAFGRELIARLLLSIESRGRHATGISVTDMHDEDTFVWKKANTASEVVKSDVWKSLVDNRITGSTMIVQGHTRWATHNNAESDECAHPFRIGQIVGAHNGVISNWRALEDDAIKQGVGELAGVPWRVDSQAIFGWLNASKDATKVLDALDGYFALSWVRKRTLYLARSHGGTLHCAYIPQYKMLVWNSLAVNLRDVLAAFDFKPSEYTIAEVEANAVIRFSPNSFGGKPRMHLTRSKVRWGSTTPSWGNSRWRDEYEGYYEGDKPAVSSIARTSSTQRNAVIPARETIIRYSDGSGWDMLLGKHLTKSEMERYDKTSTRTAHTDGRTYSLREMDEQINLLWSIVRAQAKQLRKLSQKLDNTDWATDTMWDVLSDNGMLDEVLGDLKHSTDDDDTEDVGVDTPDPHDAAPTDTPYSSATQESLPFESPAKDADTDTDTEVDASTLACSHCGKPSSPSDDHRLYKQSDGTWIGESCILRRMATADTPSEQPA